MKIINLMCVILYSKLRLEANKWAVWKAIYYFINYKNLLQNKFAKNFSD